MPKLPDKSRIVDPTRNKLYNKDKVLTAGAAIELLEMSEKERMYRLSAKQQKDLDTFESDSKKITGSIGNLLQPIEAKLPNFNYELSAIDDIDIEIPNKTTRKRIYDPKTEVLSLPDSSDIDLSGADNSRVLCEIIFIKTNRRKLNKPLRYKDLLADYEEFLRSYDIHNKNQLKRAKNYLNQKVSNNDLFLPGRGIRVNPKYLQ